MLERVGKAVVGPRLGRQAEVAVDDGALALRQDDGEAGPLGLVLEQRQHAVHGEVLHEEPVGRVVLALQGLVRHRAGQGRVAEVGRHGQQRREEAERQPHLYAAEFEPAAGFAISLTGFFLQMFPLRHCSLIAHPY